MDLGEWLPLYGQIAADFGYDPAEDLRAARILDGLIDEDDLWPTLAGKIKGARVVIAGAALEHGPPVADLLVAADGATTALIERGHLPDVIVTDLDGIVEDQIECQRKGSLVVIHAHGDNVDALVRHVPEFEGPIMGTTQVEPFGRLRNFGGFTDGDRAVMIADALGAASIVLAGFRFDRLGRYSFHRDPGVKLKKLAWARRIIGMSRAPVSFQTGIP
ncbi:MAG: DUF115 domain-containing protein [Thermoplasmata archaeon]|nr:DUF115 domain-containing protein [Thermoplasmata archaeon]